jgi:hypothetical protein
MEDCGAPASATKGRSEQSFQTLAGTLEPLPVGDRQTQKRVAKAVDPLQCWLFVVSLS